MNVFLDFRDDSPDGSLEELLSVHQYDPTNVRGNARFHTDIDHMGSNRVVAATGRLHADYQPPVFVGHFLVRVSPDAPEYEAITISTTRQSPVGRPGVTLRSCMVSYDSTYYFHDDGIVVYGAATLCPSRPA